MKHFLERIERWFCWLYRDCCAGVSTLSDQHWQTSIFFTNHFMLSGASSFHTILLFYLFIIFFFRRAWIIFFFWTYFFGNVGMTQTFYWKFLYQIRRSPRSRLERRAEMCLITCYRTGDDGPRPALPKALGHDLLSQSKFQVPNEPSGSSFSVSVSSRFRFPGASWLPSHRAYLGV